MAEISGMIKPELPALPKITSRMTFLYLEHCKINRQDSAITVLDEKGILHIPSGVISVLLLGPGTEITHRAMELIGDSGISICWIGEKGVRYYVSGCPLTKSSRLMQKQAELVSDQRKNLNVARKMYGMRFPNEDVSNLTMQQLRGREGTRIKKIYKQCSKKWGVHWDGRQYDPENFTASDSVNQALSASHACLYGLVHSVICAIGCSPALGFVHVGNINSFVYDIADLYKAEITIPISFEIASQEPEDLPRVVRRRMRDEMVKLHLLKRIVEDIKFILMPDEPLEDENEPVMCLWDGENRTVDFARQYGTGDDL